MDRNTTISISEGRKRIFEIAEEVQKPGKQYTLTENGRPKMAVMSVEERDSMLETLEVMRIFPHLDKTIIQVKKDIQTGNYKNYTTLEQLEKKYGIVADKGKKHYGVRTRPSRKRRKSS
jgi:prevent-host-death family protein